MSDEASVKAAVILARTGSGPTYRRVLACLRAAGIGMSPRRLKAILDAQIRETHGKRGETQPAEQTFINKEVSGNGKRGETRWSPLYNVRSKIEKRKDSPEAVIIREIDFGDYERDVSAFVALLAEKNASGKVTAPRVASVRAELSEWRERFGNDAMLAGVRAAIDHDVRKPVPYARAVAEHFHDPGRATNGKRPESDEPEIPDFLDLFPNGVAP